MCELHPPYKRSFLPPTKYSGTIHTWIGRASHKRQSLSQSFYEYISNKLYKCITFHPPAFAKGLLGDRVKNLFLLLFLIYFPVVNAVNLTVERDKIFSQETVYGYINLDETFSKELSLDKLTLYNKNNNKINISLFLVRLDANNHFYYFDMPKNLDADEYLIKVNDLIVSKDNKLTLINLTRNFNLSLSNYSLSIDPAIFVIDDVKEQGLLELNIFNKKEKLNVTLTTENFAKLSQSYLELNNDSGLKLQILLDSNYNYKNGINGYINVEYVNGFYSIPLYFKGFITTSNIKKLETVERQNFINLTIFNNESVSGPIKFKNTGNSNIDNINFLLIGNLDEIINLDFFENSNLYVGDILTQNLHINLNKNATPGFYYGNLVLNYDTNLYEFPIYVNILGLERNLAFNESEQEDDIITTQEPEKEKNSWFIVVFIMVIILLVLFFILKKKRKKEVKQNKFDEIISKYLRK